MILVIEDEPAIVDFLEQGLRSHGFDVHSETEGVAGATHALEASVELVVLDLMLPGHSGLEVLAAVRKARPRLPVIVLTARGELDDRVRALDAGATDYVVKPFSLAELAARIRAQLRFAAEAGRQVVRAGDIELDLLTREARRDGRAVQLSTTEFELLAYLVEHRGAALTREQILRAVWGYEHDPGTNTVDVYIGYLRRKLRSGPDDAPIFTVRSVGYRLGDAA